MRHLSSYKIILSLLILAIDQPSYAQRPAQYPQLRWIVTAPVILPELVQKEDWERVQNFLENWKRSEVPNEEFIFSIGLLSSIESGKFTMYQLPCAVFDLLDSYSRGLKVEAGSSQFRYYIAVTNRYSFDATEDARKLFVFTRSWARRLIVTQKLDSTESFLCRVFAGYIQNPGAVVRRNKESYAALNAFREDLENNNNRYFTARRNRRVGTAGIMVGSWSPTGNLRTLGTHPSVGVSLGIRNKMNEYDLVWSFRFLHPTPGSYTYLRHDTLFTSDYYDGGYIGFDYTRYVVHQPHFELGFISAVGYDYFSVASGFGGEYHIQPLNVGSFDFSNGVRLKYFFHRRSFIGLAAKYHLIHYSNEGGTDLSGNAVTVDLIYGSH